LTVVVMTILAIDADQGRMRQPGPEPTTGRTPAAVARV
ncbi:MAG: hypothetical protein QOJ89_5206, partial [bacterium]